MTDDTEAIRARLNAATNLYPARTYETTMNDQSLYRFGPEDAPQAFKAEMSGANAEFIANAPADIEFLLGLTPTPGEAEAVFRPNPEMPSDAQLLEWYDLAEDQLADAQDGLLGLRAIWRAGCDTGMVAP